jgi:hypothetical protein
MENVAAQQLTSEGPEMAANRQETGFEHGKIMPVRLLVRLRSVAVTNGAWWSRNMPEVVDVTSRSDKLFNKHR